MGVDATNAGSAAVHEDGSKANTLYRIPTGAAAAAKGGATSCRVAAMAVAS